METIKNEKPKNNEGQDPKELESNTAEASIRLPVPEKIQETDYYCAVACLQMVLEYHGIVEDQAVLAKQLNAKPITGTEYEDLAREASVYIFGKEPETDTDPGYRATLWTQNQAEPNAKAIFEERVKTDLEHGDPVFVSINVAPAYGYTQDAVHELVLYGADYDDSGKALMYYCIDPSYRSQDPQYGGKKMWSSDALWNFMNDNPEPGYVW